MNRKLNILITLTCFIVISFFVISLYKELKPKTLEEQKMHCLELGSNARAEACLNLLRQEITPPAHTSFTPTPLITNGVKRISIVLGTSEIIATNISNQTFYKCFFILKAKGDKFTEYKGFFHPLTNEDFNESAIWALTYESEPGAKDVVAKLMPQESVVVFLNIFYEYNSKPVNQTFSPPYSSEDISSIKTTCTNADGNKFEEVTVFK